MTMHKLANPTARLERLMHQALNREAHPTEGCKKSLLFLDNRNDIHTTPGMSLAASALVVPAALNRIETAPVNRRQVVRIAAATTGVAAGVLWLEPQESEAGFWAFVTPVLFGAALTWLTNKVLDGVYAWATDYQVTANDLTRTNTPRPSTSQFHNDYAPPYEVTNKDKHIAPVRVDEYGTTFGMDEYQLFHEVNYVEYQRIRKEYDNGLFPSVLLPSTERIPVKDRHQRAVNLAAQSYGLKRGEVAEEYLVGLVDKKGKEHIGIGAKVDNKENLLIL